MTQDALVRPESAPTTGLEGVTADWSGDKQAFPVPWGKVMMWIFLLSDTFIFSCFLTSYMNVRISTTATWPDPSKVFALDIAGHDIPLLLIAIMTMVLIVAFTLLRNLLCHQIPRQSRPCDQTRSECWPAGPNAHAPS